MRYFIIFLLLLIAGCASEYNLATQQEERIYYSTDKEVAMGESIDKALMKEKEFKLTEDPLLLNRVEEIGKKIVAVCDRKEIKYHFRVLDDEEVNAASLPGGYVYINKGLIEKVANDDELAGVIAHEVSHVVARHSVKRLQAAMGYSLLRILVAVAPEGGKVGAGADAAFAEILMGYSRDDEILADRLAARYLKLAGYNPQAMIAFLEKLHEVNRKRPAQPKSYYKTHPYVPDRIRAVKQELGQQMSFDDYINIEQKPTKPFAQ